MTPQEKDRIECAIRHIQTATDIDPWAAEIAVEAMKAQLSREDTTSDPISRQAAVDTVESFDILDGYTDQQELIRRIRQLPSEPQWIPVSERLPEVGRSVLFSRRSMDTREGCLQADGKWWQYRWNEILNADQVTAWMPLPDLYRADLRG